MPALLTIWTIRGALLLLAAVLLGRLTGAPWATSKSARWMWTAGLSAAVVHVLLAMHFYHAWSHRAAMLETARQLEAQIGWSFGGGIYFNYAFLGVWSADAAWWWAHPQSFLERSRWWAGLANGFLLFIAWNAAVVFEDGATRVAGHLITAGMVVAWAASRMRGETWKASR